MLAGAVLLSSTACSSLFGGDSPVPDMSGTPSASNIPLSGLDVENTEETESPEDTTEADVEAIMVTMNGYYDYITQPETLASVKQAGERFSGLSEAEVTDDDLDEMVADFPEGFQYFDTSSGNRIKAAYMQLLTGSSLIQSLPGLSFDVPQEAVTVAGDTATVNQTIINILKNGEDTGGDDDVNSSHLTELVKQDGTWVIVGEMPAAK